MFLLWYRYLLYWSALESVMFLWVRWVILLLLNCSELRQKSFSPWWFFLATCELQKLERALFFGSHSINYLLFPFLTCISEVMVHSRGCINKHSLKLSLEITNFCFSSLRGLSQCRLSSRWLQLHILSDHWGLRLLEVMLDSFGIINQGRIQTPQLVFRWLIIKGSTLFTSSTGCIPWYILPVLLDDGHGAFVSVKAMLTWLIL